MTSLQRCIGRIVHELAWTGVVVERSIRLRFRHRRSLSVGYMYYLYKAYHGPSPASQMVTLSMPCDATDAQSYPMTIFKARMLFVDGVGTSLAGGLGDGQTPIGVQTPLTATGSEAFNHRHGVCVNLRGEVKASHMDRTMLEVTHCCGTADYSA